MKQTQGFFQGQLEVNRLAHAGRAVLASSMVERPLLRTKKKNETQKVLLIASVSFLLLFACTLIDFFAFR
jgi:hypothetical protein